MQLTTLQVLDYYLPGVFLLLTLPYLLDILFFLLLYVLLLTSPDTHCWLLVTATVYLSYPILFHHLYYYCYYYHRILLSLSATMRYLAT